MCGDVICWRYSLLDSARLRGVSKMFLWSSDEWKLSIRSSFISLQHHSLIHSDCYSTRFCIKQFSSISNSFLCCGDGQYQRWLHNTNPMAYFMQWPWPDSTLTNTSTVHCTHMILHCWIIMMPTVHNLTRDFVFLSVLSVVCNESESLQQLMRWWLTWKMDSLKN